MSLLPIEAVDVDGAIREADEAVAGDTRAGFFRKAAVGGGAVLGSSAFLAMLPEMALARPSRKQDLRILQYALVLEHLEAAFYSEAANSGALSGDAQQVAELLASHEQTHVQAIRQTIKAFGGKPKNSPAFDFQGTTQDPGQFIQTAFVLENTGTRAYLGQAPRIKSRKLLAAAGAILAVEARHAAAIAVLIGDNPFVDGSGVGSGKDNRSITPFGAFDRASSMKRILREVGNTGFIQQ